jgi:hypothetical protein
MTRSCSFIASSITSNLPGSQFGSQKTKAGRKIHCSLSKRCNLQLFKLSATLFYLFVISGHIWTQITLLQVQMLTESCCEVPRQIYAGMKCCITLLSLWKKTSLTSHTLPSSTGCIARSGKLTCAYTAATWSVTLIMRV